MWCGGEGGGPEIRTRNHDNHGTCYLVDYGGRERDWRDGGAGGWLGGEAGVWSQSQANKSLKLS